MNYNVIIPTGYMGSGSSAITDLLSEVDGYSCLNGNYEYVFMHCPNGLFDLEDKLLKGNNVVRSDEALHSFYNCMKNLYANKHYWVADYKTKIGSDFIDWINTLINSLINDRITDSYWYYQENPNLEIYLKKLISKLLSIVTNKKIKLKPGLTYNEMWVSYPSNEDFYASAKIFLDKFFCEMGIKQNHIILDQFLLPHNIYRAPNYFNENYKIIVVERDPRDVFILNKYYWRDSNCPVPYSFDVKKFCENYKKMRDMEIINTNSNVKRIHFEDLVYNYDNEVEDIFRFLGISKEKHLKPFTKLNPKKSILNTQLFEQNINYKEESEYIKKELSEYIYDFPYPVNERLSKKDLIL